MVQNSADLRGLAILPTSARDRLYRFETALLDDPAVRQHFYEQPTPTAMAQANTGPMNADHVMNISALPGYNGLYCNVCDGEFRLFTADFRVLYSDSNDFTLRRGQREEKYCHGQQCIFQPNLYSSVLCGGRIFVQFFNVLLELKGDRLQVVNVIPQLPLTHPNCFYCRMYNSEDALYINTGLSVLKLQRSSKLVEVQKAQGFGFFGSFCSTSVGFYPGKRLVLVQGTHEQTLHPVDPDVVQFSFCQGGVICVHNEAATKVLVMDLINFQLAQCTDTDITVRRARSSLVLHECGLSLQRSKLAKLFGPEFVELRDQAWRDFAAQFVAKPTYPAAELQEMFKVAKIDPRPFERFPAQPTNATQVSTQEKNVHPGEAPIDAAKTAIPPLQQVQISQRVTQPEQGSVDTRLTKLETRVTNVERQLTEILAALQKLQ